MSGNLPPNDGARRLAGQGVGLVLGGRGGARRLAGRRICPRGGCRYEKDATKRPLCTWHGGRFGGFMPARDTER
jgi:hypothetical protein